MMFTTNFELQSQTTRLHELLLFWWVRHLTGFSPSMTWLSNQIRCFFTFTPVFTLQLTLQWFWLGLLPLHSPLLRESLLFSFPLLVRCFNSAGLLTWFEIRVCVFVKRRLHRDEFGTHPIHSTLPFQLFHTANLQPSLEPITNTQTSILPKEVQCAFKDLMTHRVLQFALPIAFRCVLHRFKSQDIHRD